MTRPSAAFVDRDGTLIVDRHYLRDPEKLRFVDRAPEAIVALNRAGVPVVVVTNQSGIGRGLLTEAEYRAVEEELEKRLAARGAVLAAAYHCPHDPTAVRCECRKPGLALYERARHDLGEVELSRALFIGDRLRDVLPGLASGGRSFLVRTGHPLPASVPAGCEVADDLWDAVRMGLE